MTQIAIQAQVDAIKKVTQEVVKSKEAALQFLVDAGIVKDDKPSNTQSQTTIEKKK